MTDQANPALPIAQSTIDATRWIRKFAPERLEAWLDRHEPGLLAQIKNEDAEAKQGDDVDAGNDRR